MSPTLNIIGAGKLAQTLAYLWRQQQVFTVAQLLCRNLTSAQQAGAFIFQTVTTEGNSQCLDRWSNLSAAEVWLIATPDGAIETCAEKLAESGLLRPNDVVFHCSGALSSSALQKLENCGAHTASIHPVHSFAKPEDSIDNFAGSFCACEGSNEALSLLEPAFATIGGKLLEIKESEKVLYHAASVMGCNYLVALLEASLETFVRSGIDKKVAQQLLLPIVHQTADNVLLGSAVDALTGPIARGDTDTIAKQISALEVQPQIADIYKALGISAANIAQQQGQVPPHKIAEIIKLLSH